MLISYWELRRGECKVQFHRDVEFVSGCIIYYESSAGESVRCSSTCFRLYWSLIECSTGESAKSKRIWNAFIACNYLLLRKTSTGERVKYSSTRIRNVFSIVIISYWENSAEERVKYSSTRIWNVFWTVIIFYWKTPQGRVKIQFHRDMECILDWNYLWLKNPLGRA